MLSKQEVAEMSDENQKLKNIISHYKTYIKVIKNRNKGIPEKPF